jgi:hypothetical protein
MKELTQYVAQKNKWNAIFKGDQYSLNSAVDRQAIAECLGSDLSPENLTCDGELPRAQVLARKRMLDKAAEQLLALDPSVKMYEFYTGE